ncbi:MAG: hypothetical protein RIN56_18675 [Sporomusaceae bacterium]|nr:hypothetical protein [Sporomusaceae bacterium]
MGHKENEKLTELSAALDALNRGEQPDSGDEETKELAEVALLLKRTGPPPAVLAGLVDKLGDELAAKRKRRRLWLTSGAAGTAAAAMLVFAFNLGPSAPPPPQLAIPPAGSVVIESIPAPQPATDVAAGAAKADMAKDGSAAAKRPAQTADTAAASVREAAPPAQDRPVAAAADGGRNEQRMMLAKAPEKAPEKAANKLAKTPATPTAAYLAWPGRQPDEVTVDKATATIRQVYGRGDAAIVIIQRAAPDTAQAAADGAAEVSAAKGKTNRVTVTVKDTVVTVEGNLPEDELEKIARSLE